jgi:histidinol phosphate phosphatase HisJ family
MDSDLDAELACEKAISINLDGIAFTDHHDLDYPGDEKYEISDFNKYDYVMEGLKEKYKSKLNVLKGIEIGIQPHVIKESYEVIKKNCFDYVLASVHIIDGVDPYYKVYYEGKTRNEAYGQYLQKILYAVAEFPDFDNLGHFEYIIRYASYDDRSLRYSDYAGAFDEILKILVCKGKGFEINTGSFRENQGITTVEFDLDILKRYRELGGEIISLGSDAHSAEYIGYKHEYFKEILLKAGFKYEVHFENRKPIYTRMD